MLVAIYTGGTPNIAAMKTALNVDNELYILTHTYEVALGAIYLIFILSIAKSISVIPSLSISTCCKWKQQY